MQIFIYSFVCFLSLSLNCNLYPLSSPLSEENCTTIFPELRNGHLLMHYEDIHRSQVFQLSTSSKHIFPKNGFAKIDVDFIDVGVCDTK